jgi:hypothetical protein
MTLWLKLAPALIALALVVAAALFAAPASLYA